MLGRAGSVAALLTGWVGTADATMMDGLDTLPAGFVPRLETITPDHPVHFVRRGSGCPNRTPACEERAYLVHGNGVVVIAAQGDYVDAVFTGGAPRFRSTRGWLPRGALAPAPAAARNWVGTWSNGSDSIDIRPAADGRLEFSGTATWGGDDPKRVATGGVNVGDFDTSLTPSGDAVSFSPNLDGNGAPAALNPSPDADACVLRMWLRDPYLVVADNGRCGGANVTFSNVYRRVGTRP